MINKLVNKWLSLNEKIRQKLNRTGNEGEARGGVWAFLKAGQRRPHLRVMNRRHSALRSRICLLTKAAASTV